MKTTQRCSRMVSLAAILLSGMVALASRSPTRQPPAPPRVLSLQVTGERILLRVWAPPGARKLTLESRRKLGHGAWVPRAVQRLDGQGGEVIFEVSLNPEAAEIFRVRADATEPLPATFYEGETAFAGALSAGGFPAPGDLELAPPNGGAPSEVQESDIWRLDGDTLYFFNQFRGLQVVEVSDPDAPRLRGQLPVRAAGEQMYVLDANHVLLLIAHTRGSQQRQVWVVRTDGVPEVVARLDLAGTVLESRLIGRVLYVVTSVFAPAPGGEPGANPDGEPPREEYRWEAVVTAFDLTDPGAPVKGDELRLPGNGGVVQATDRWLMVALREKNFSWRNQNSVVHLIDLAPGNGRMRRRGAVRVLGRIADKFKLHVDGDVLSVIAEDWRTARVSRLETFSLADPDRPVKLGELEVGHGEALFATRFDGDRVYVVTFERVDPLWIVDLSDPRHPSISGELEIPGWSTYLHPMGDRLVAVGIDNTDGWKVAVQLFDVADPAHPALLAKVPLGEDHSWSEANHDEKAFTVLEDEGLILLPYQEWSANGQQVRVRLIDLTRNGLRARGVIEHEVQPRRATSHRGRLLSLSGRELVTVDATDRDAPVVTSLLELAWPVNRVRVIGDYLIEVADGSSWLGREGPRLRVALRAAPEEPLAEFAPPDPWPIVGCAERDGRLYLLQVRLPAGWGPLIEGEDEPAAGSDNLCLTALGLDEPPTLPVLDRVRASVPELSWQRSWKALWPQPGLLVWAARGYARGFWLGPGIDVAPPAAGMPWPRWGGPGGRFLVFAAPADGALAFQADVQPGEREAWTAASEAFAAAGLIWFSEQRTTFLPGVKWPNQPPGETGAYLTRYYLRVLDLSDPAEPTFRPPVNLPGALRGVTDDGAVLYTEGPRFDAEGQSDGRRWFSACAYDGVSASLITQAPLPQTSWATPLAVPGGWVVADWDAAETQTGELALWRLDENGKFTTLAKAPLEHPVGEAAVLNGLLLITDGLRLALYQTSAGGLVRRGGLERPAGVGFRLSDVAGGPEVGFWAPLGDYGVTLLAPIP